MEKRAFSMFPLIWKKACSPASKTERCLIPFGPSSGVSNGIMTWVCARIRFIWVASVLLRKHLEKRKIPTMININDLNPEYITDENGTKKSVILPIEEFEELMEDIEDLAIIAERRNESTISHKELVEELKEDGLL
jgi:PHD/YefM family antitoxin component YafN of YafNO toxin-antitoxin module